MSFTVTSYYFPQTIKRRGWVILLTHADGHFGTSSGNTSLKASVSADYSQLLDSLRHAGLIRSPYKRSFLEQARQGFIFPMPSSTLENPTDKERDILYTMLEIPTKEFYGRSSTSFLERAFGGNVKTTREALELINRQIDRLPPCGTYFQDLLKRKNLI